MDRDDGVQYFLQQFSTFIMADSFIGGIWRGFMPSFVNDKKGALDSQPQVIKFTMVGGSLRVLRLLPPLKLVAMIIILLISFRQGIFLRFD
jgi:hypothetical protein